MPNVVSTQPTFRDLAIGQTFDFVKPNLIYNSFYRRCVKTSARCYETIDAPVMNCRVGSISCEVYNVS